MDNEIVPQKEVEIEAPKLTKLKPQNEMFVNLYVSGMSGVQAYAETRKYDLRNPASYMVAANGATKLLKNVKIAARINEKLTLAGFNDEGADKALNYGMHQMHDLKSKLVAVKLYNELKGRVAKNGSKAPTINFNLAQVLQQASKEEIITQE